MLQSSLDTDPLGTADAVSSLGQGASQKMETCRQQASERDALWGMVTVPEASLASQQGLSPPQVSPPSLAVEVKADTWLRHPWSQVPQNPWTVGL